MRAVAPQINLAVDDVGVGPDRDPAADQTASPVSVAQRRERQLEHLGDLARTELPGLPRLDQADERVHGVAGGDRGRGLQRAHQLDRFRGQTDLLVGLAQRRRSQIGIALVAATAGERDLARVAAKVGAALGEDRPQLTLIDVQRNQHRGVDSSAHVECDRILGAQAGRAAGARGWHRQAASSPD